MKTSLTNKALPTHNRRDLQSSRYKPQARAKAMKNRILDAALLTFAERGFDNSNLDLVAAQAGCSRGAIYAHYRSKDKVFLELFQERIANLFTALCDELAQQPQLPTRIATFRRWLLKQIASPNWGILMLEFKLYCIRHPETREKLMNIYGGLRYPVVDFEDLLFGNEMEHSHKKNLTRRLIALSTMLSGLTLEYRLRPQLFSSEDLLCLAEDSFDSLFALRAVPMNIANQQDAT